MGHSAHSGYAALVAPFIDFTAFAHGLHFGHDIGERLLDGLLEEPALALALRVFGVGQSGQRAVDVLQARCHGHLSQGGENVV